MEYIYHFKGHSFFDKPKIHTVLNPEHVLQKVNGNQLMYLKTKIEWVWKQVLHLKKITDIRNVMLTSYPEHHIVDIEHHMFLQH